MLKSLFKKAAVSTNLV